MNFHDTLVPLLRADLAQALAVPEEAVYVGDRPQKVSRRGLEVWVEPDPSGLVIQGALIEHPYRVHVRLKKRREHAKTGKSPVSQVQGHVIDVLQRYSGERPFAAALPALIAVQADDTALTSDPDEPDVLDGSVLFRFLEA